MIREPRDVLKYKGPEHFSLKAQNVKCICYNLHPAITHIKIKNLEQLGRFLLWLGWLATLVGLVVYLFEYLFAIEVDCISKYSFSRCHKDSIEEDLFSLGYK